MSKKRKRDSALQEPEKVQSTDGPHPDLSKKRKREVDLELIKVYEDLADDQENVRLAAAHTLLSNFCQPGHSDEGQTKTILTRLFRGLCSGRKSARLGFSVALTELLSQLATTKENLEQISVSSVIDILENQSAPETGTSGQDERDHYYGRVFGAEAILKSGLLFEDGYESHFSRLLELLCALALKKPWLRQECGWVLFSCILAEHNNIPGSFAAETIDKLVANKLIRTPEGVAIWIATTRRFPEVKLPASAWKSGDPLARKDVDVLADILKDARAHPDQQISELSAQGSARWSANLHFAWDVVLAEIFRITESKANLGKKHKNMNTDDKKLTFKVFWDTVVDESLFATSSSAERRAWGFGLWRKVFETAPHEVLFHTFTTNALRRLADSLKSSEKPLQKSAQRVTQSIQSRLVASSSWQAAGEVAASYVRALLQSVSYADFDQITKSRTLQSLIDALNPAMLRRVNSALSESLAEMPRQEDRKDSLSLQKSLITLQWKIASSRLRHWEEAQWSDRSDIDEEDWALVAETFESWLREVCLSPTAKIPKDMAGFRPIFQPEAREITKERLNLGFEQALKLGLAGCQVMEHVLSHLRQLESHEIEMRATFEDDVQDIVQAAWLKLSPTQAGSKKTSKVVLSTTESSKGPGQAQFLSFSGALHLLYCLLLYQVYSEDTEAVQLLQEVLELDKRRSATQRKSKVADVEEESADAIMEILLSFASRPSKLLRRITVQIFDALAASLTSDGLAALCRVLETKENLQGQQEMFQVDDEDMLDGQASGTDSDVDELDSDVEVDSLSKSAESEEDSDNASGSEEPEEDSAEDEELAKFDAALAAALGTRTLNQHDLAAPSDDSSSDEDMDDDQMMELDSKLAEVFRARNEQQSKNKKKDTKEAKENVVNFKNRVLDLIESYFKHQQQRPLTIDLLLPMLKLARTTQTKQLADRSCNIVQQFCSRCKGPNVPELQDDFQKRHAIDVLKHLHKEASMESSNAQSNVTSLSSILVVKALVKADPAIVKEVVEVYAFSRIKQLTEKKSRILPGFFTDWNNWCQTAREKLAV
ncbi:DNA-directed DNA polymerase [Cladophialophora chaetospira]|uniref:DNA-directed DNA polymerase n=1 Tax=Cladophialophora chaetospira TaxID=386627 RepID=A0AA38X5P3_9EURO|nr:DNA-directed DNA polymerase [Cladophialophora chaetospira]